MRHLLPSSFFLLSSCIIGEVVDPTTNQRIPNAHVVGVGDCQGTGCLTPDLALTQTTSAGGFAFDAYASADEVDLRPGNGHETIGLLLFKTGYRARWVFHVPRYKQASNGEYYTEVATSYLAPSAGWLDSDSDGLSDDEEARLGTDPFNNDTDGDSLSDLVETLGVDFINLGDRGASPMRKDVFVECDYMPGYRPSAVALDDVVAAFANSPVQNPDGSTGITLHIDIDEELIADADYDLDPALDELMDIKEDHFNPARAPYYRYCLWTQRHSGGNSTGLANIGGDDFIVSLGGLHGDTLAESSTFMHELGHTFGFLHGGADTTNHKPNYLSVMNYAFQLRGLRRNGQQDLIDYSRFLLAPLNEAQLFEPAGLDPLNGVPWETEIFQYRTRITTHSNGSGVWTGPASSNINWNRSVFGVQNNAVAADINGDGLYAQLNGSDDWQALSFFAPLGVVGSGPGIDVGPSGAEECETTECLVRMAETSPTSLPPSRRSTPMALTASTNITTCASVPASGRFATHSGPAAAVAFRQSHDARGVRAQLDLGVEEGSEQ